MSICEYFAYLHVKFSLELTKLHLFEKILTKKVLILLKSTYLKNENKSKYTRANRKTPKMSKISVDLYVIYYCIG